ncbi:MAG: apiosidase-like domain-containing protein [Candidatus Caldatribacteriaceae bacterium]
MSFLQVAPEKTHFLKNGRPFFYLADTVWSALTSVTEEEWKEYLTYRRLQGFNVLQINLLHQWDASIPYLRFPFRRDIHGNYASFELDESYFGFAERLLQMASEEGFVPALVLLWCNFVPGTWGSQRKISPVMPFSVMERYVRYAVERFSKFYPIFIISGDTDFGSDVAVKYYLRALEMVKSVAPEAPTTLHLQPQADLPEEIVRSSYLDFYMYQSGHLGREQHLPYVLAQRFFSKSVKRPIVNGEPCYEGHPYGFTKDGSFGERDIRKAIWQSLLGGASAGVSYGAHGIWSWHRRGSEFRGTEFSGEPFEWRIALTFPGAWAASFAKFVFEEFGLFGIQPANELLVGMPDEIRLAGTMNLEKFALYTPLARNIVLRINLEQYEKIIGIDLSKRRFFVPSFSREDVGIWILKMPPYNTDIFILGTKSW